MPHGVSGLSWRIRAYLTVVIATGCSVVGVSLYDLAQQPIQKEWLLLGVLTLLTGSFSIKLPSVSARISVSEALVIAAVLLYGQSVATAIVALDTIILTSWRHGRRRSPVRTLFNVSAGATAIWISAHLFHSLIPQAEPAPRLEQLLVPVLLLSVSYFAINSSLVAVAVAAERGISPFEVWHRNFAWISLNYIGGASVAMLLVAYQRNIDLTALGVMVPLLIITYFAFRTSLGRLEDAHRHVAQLNELYLSTIETLAMAVDAKDQITHGHIRRVQVYAVELAKYLGVTNGEQLKAIEAAALLHDMGKLAIPEHILNKPGKLTTAEFDKMKRHADIGADLLSSVRFPYPVVPIVRHHHEQWNGHGYPSGISGTDIPLGARILAVVDCFDALNSDRPYRPRMSVDESFRILRERRSSMYDPLVVDSFIALYPNIAETAALAGEQARSLIMRDTIEEAYASSLQAIRTSAVEVSALQEAAKRIGAAREDSEAFEIVCRYIRDLLPVSACCFFTYSVETDRLICTFAAGEGTSALLGFSIQTGERVSGWAAANRKTVCNADPTLDLGESAALLRTAPSSAMSTPAITTKNSALAGVLTVFSPKLGAFSNAHVYTLEQLATLLADNLRLNGRVQRLVEFPRRQQPQPR